MAPLPLRNTLLFATSLYAAIAFMACGEDDEGGAQDDSDWAQPPNNAGATQGHSGACKGCGALLRGEIISPSQVCGFHGHGMDGEPLCEPETPCQRFADVYACTCGAGGTGSGACNDPDSNESCSTTACLNASPSATCQECIMAACTEQVGACMQAM